MWDTNQMKSHYVIGLNSGTSFDGVDVALVRFFGDLKPRFIDGIIYTYPKIVKEKIRKLIYRNNVHLQEISQLNFLLGEIFAEAVNKIIKKNKLRQKDILLIASHGQTIYHHPDIERISSYKVRSTFQIGEGSVIAFKTGIQTITNFREADIAAGGTGAPLVPYLDQIIFGESKNIRAVLNIGGISNITITGKNITPAAFDVGPGNGLIDLMCNLYFKKDFDNGGEIAKKGKIDFNAVKKALRDPYFRKKPPKSTGKEYFNLNFVKKYFSKIKKRKDKISTITYFSAKVTERAFNDFIFPNYKINEIITSGGGVKNKILMKHLRKLIPSIRFNTSDKYGLPYKYKEAILFALLGYTCHLKKPNNMPSCTGAKEKTILGKMTRIERK